jgi:hypothetical protein
MKGYSGPFLLFSLLGGFFLYLFAYCSFGWWGVLGLAATSGLISVIVRSEQAAEQARRHRAEQQHIQRWAESAARSPRRSRGASRRGRGGVR